MIDKYIYIPTGLEAGMKKGFSKIIYIDTYYPTTNQGRGNTDLDELNKGKFDFYSLDRCYPYSDEIWKLCQMHQLKRIDINNEYDKIVKGARKKNKKFPTIG